MSSKEIEIRVELDTSRSDPLVIIRTGQRTEQIERIIRAVELCGEGKSPRVTVYDGNTAVFLEQQDIFSVHTENRRIIVNTMNGTYVSRLTLREYEDILEEDSFVRISRFELVNLNHVLSFDLSMAGTIRITFENGTETWVARRYVRSIQEKLSLKNRQGGGKDE